MDFNKHHDAFNNGGRPKGPPSVIKSEPRSISPCYNRPDETLRNPPIPPSGSVGLLGGISCTKRLRPPDEWLTPRSPVTITMPPNSASSGGGGGPSSSSPGPGHVHPGVYPSTSNGYPSPTMSTSSYDLYNSQSKMSKYM